MKLSLTDCAFPNDKKNIRILKAIAHISFLEAKDKMINLKKEPYVFEILDSERNEILALLQSNSFEVEAITPTSYKLYVLKVEEYFIQRSYDWVAIISALNEKDAKRLFFNKIEEKGGGILFYQSIEQIGFSLKEEEGIIYYYHRI